MKILPPIDEDAVKGIDLQQSMITAALTAAALYVTEYGDACVPVDASCVESSGASFTIPLVIPEGVFSGDDRTISEGALTLRDLPLPLRWQEVSGPGHDGSYIVGRIDSIERVGNGLGNARGVFDVGPYGREAERLVRGGFLRGVSADLDQFRASVETPEGDEFAGDAEIIQNEQIVVNGARLMGATLVATPAFQECFIVLDQLPSLDDGDDDIADGVYEDQLDDIDNELAALAASAAPMVPPKGWFVDPKLNGPTPLTITDDGKVYGHIAAWNVSHIGLPRATKPPRSASKYAYFRTGLLRTDEGDVSVGQLTLAGGHAPLAASARDAVKHYDDTASAVADVVAGEDAFGIWVAGALRPEVTPGQVRAFRASSPSGDWRPINGRLELVAVCQVNVPGFPVARTMIASGKVTALVAAGAAPLAELRESQSLRFQDVEERLHRIELRELNHKRELAMAEMEPIVQSHQQELLALAASAMADMEPIIEAHNAELAARAEAIKTQFDNLF